MSPKRNLKFKCVLFLLIPTSSVEGRHTCMDLENFYVAPSFSHGYQLTLVEYVMQQNTQSRVEGERKRQMTFATPQCVHNLPQTSNSMGKVIATKYLKKNRQASGGRCAVPLPITPSITGGQLPLEVCFTHWCPCKHRLAWKRSRSL
jgi:hypothetical protein